MRKVVICCILLFLLFYQKSFSQKPIKAFCKLSVYEKIWVVNHPVIAKKCYKITLIAKETTDSLKKDSLLDANDSGGQLDAFRHAYWMAMLNQRVKEKKARKLGIAHEKKNKADFRKNRYEDGSVPDSVLISMDLLNNNIGLNIGRKYPNASKSALINLVIDNILDGNLWILKSDNDGNYLDLYNQILKESDYSGKWNSGRCLVKSNYIKN